MSQYIEFFVKSKEDNFTCITSFSRNNDIYQVLMNTVPYGKICKLTHTLIANAIDNLQKTLTKYHQIRLNHQNEIANVCTFNNSVEDKLMAIENIRDNMIDLDEEIADLDEAIKYLQILQSMVDEMYYTPDIGLYCGIEVGSPTVDDIVSF
jgi:hypothetical protein